MSIFVNRILNMKHIKVIGFDMDGLDEREAGVFTNHPTLKDVLFVHTPHEITME